MVRPSPCTALDRVFADGRCSAPALLLQVTAGELKFADGDAEQGFDRVMANLGGQAARGANQRVPDPSVTGLGSFN